MAKLDDLAELRNYEIGVYSGGAKMVRYPGEPEEDDDQPYFRPTTFDNFVGEEEKPEGEEGEEGEEVDEETERLKAQFPLSFANQEKIAQ